MGKRVEKDLSLHGRKGHFTEGGEKAYTDEPGIKFYPLEKVPAISPTARYLLYVTLHLSRLRLKWLYDVPNGRECFHSV